MPVFRNIFGCSSRDSNESLMEIKSEIDRLKTKVNVMESGIVRDIKHLEEKYNDILRILQEIKIDIRLLSSK